MKTLSTASLLVSNLEEVISIFDRVDGVKTINDFVKRVEFLSDKFSSDTDFLNTFKGNMFEIFSEIFFEIFKADPSVGLTNYKSVEISDDYGVDAIAFNPNGDQCLVQCKYRSNPLEEILYGDLAKTYSSGREMSNVAVDKHDTIYLITTCSGANHISHKVFKKKLRVINRNIISNRVDNNKTFWDEAELIITSTLDTLDNLCKP